MTDLTLPIQPGGLLLDVLIGLNAVLTQDLLDAGLPLVRPVKVTAFIDTGADLNGISTRLVQTLQLPVVHTLQITTAGGMSALSCYEISLSILNATGTGIVFAIPNLFVTGMPTPPAGMEALVGLDIVLQCVLIIDGPNRQFTLRCPP
jgi:hypothetical protein